MTSRFNGYNKMAICHPTQENMTMEESYDLKIEALIYSATSVVYEENLKRKNQGIPEQTKSIVIVSKHKKINVMHEGRVRRKNIKLDYELTPDVLMDWPESELVKEKWYLTEQQLRKATDIAASMVLDLLVEQAEHKKRQIEKENKESSSGQKNVSDELDKLEKTYDTSTTLSKVKDENGQFRSEEAAKIAELVRKRIFKALNDMFKAQDKEIARKNNKAQKRQEKI